MTDEPDPTPNPNPPDPIGESRPLTDAERDQLLDLAAAVCDDHADAAVIARLDALLAAHADARRLYRRYLDLHMHVADITGAADPSIPMSTPDSYTTPAAQSTPTRSPLRMRRVAYPAAAIILLAAAVTIAIIFSAVPSAPRHTNPPAVASVATLTNLDNATFAPTSVPAPLGSALPPGPFRLTSGSAQLMFASTAVVDLTGPCDIEMTGPNRARLRRGTLNAYVPPAAHGFTLDLPDNTRVIDLGTRFHIALTPAPKPRAERSEAPDASSSAVAAVDLTVSEGRVRLERSGFSRILTAGSRVTFAPGDPDPADIRVATGFRMLDDFQSMSTGVTVAHDTGWFALPDHTGNVHAVLADPAAHNIALYLKGLSNGGQDRGVSRSLDDLAVDNTQIATLFLRLRVSGPSISTSFGLSDKPAPLSLDFDNFAVQLAVTGGRDGAVNLNAADTTLTALRPEQWYNLWLVIDPGDNAFDVYLQAPGESAPHRIGRDIAFRHRTTRNLIAFFALAANTRAADDLQLDDIALAPGQSLTIPDKTNEKTDPSKRRPQ